MLKKVILGLLAGAITGSITSFVVSEPFNISAYYLIGGIALIFGVATPLAIRKIEAE